MFKIDEDVWAEKMLDAHPPKGYGLTIERVVAMLRRHRDPVLAVTASYNYGFSRGRSYERNKKRK